MAAFAILAMFSNRGDTLNCVCVGLLGIQANHYLQNYCHITFYHTTRSQATLSRLQEFEYLDETLMMCLWMNILELISYVDVYERAIFP